VKSRKDLIEKIIPHFDKYPLQAKKYKWYLLWKESVGILYAADKKRKTIFSPQELTAVETERLTQIREEMANMQTGGSKNHALNVIVSKKAGKVTKEGKNN
jgi:hypothetical protein